MSSLADFGVPKADENLPFFRPDSKASRIRVLEVLPTPAPFTVGDGLDAREVRILVRLLVETPAGLQQIWDVTSKRALSALHGLEDVKAWFTVRRAGRGTGSTFHVHPWTKDTPEAADTEADEGEGRA